MSGKQKTIAGFFTAPAAKRQKVEEVSVVGESSKPDDAAQKSTGKAAAEEPSDEIPFPTMKEASWRGLLNAEAKKPYFIKLMKFVESERKAKTVFPPDEETFTALNETPLDKVKVVILGQDPYHGAGQAHGLAFSVKPDVRPLPPSLRNMLKELKDEGLISKEAPNGSLLKWAGNGVLLLNTCLTVRSAEPNSHAKMGWETFTMEVIKKINKECDGVVFLLFGKPAQVAVGGIVDRSKHDVIETAHPSPLSASKGFFGSKPFSRANACLAKRGKEPIDWTL